MRNDPDSFRYGLKPWVSFESILCCKHFSFLSLSLSHSVFSVCKQQTLEGLLKGFLFSFLFLFFFSFFFFSFSFFFVWAKFLFFFFFGLLMWLYLSWIEFCFVSINIYKFYLRNWERTQNKNKNTQKLYYFSLFLNAILNVSNC